MHIQKITETPNMTIRTDRFEYYATEVTCKILGGKLVPDGRLLSFSEWVYYTLTNGKKLIAHCKETFRNEQPKWTLTYNDEQVGVFTDKTKMTKFIKQNYLK